MDISLDKKKAFSLFIANTDLAYRQFCVWRKLQNKQYNPVYKRNGIFWDAVMKSLFMDSLSFLAKSFEKRNDKFDDVLSIYWLCGLEFSDCDKIVMKLKKLRNKLLMHSDFETAKNLEKFLKEISLKYEDIEQLFEKLKEVLEKTKKDFQNSTDFEQYFQELEKNAGKDVLGIMKLLR